MAAIDRKCVAMTVAVLGAVACGDDGAPPPPPPAVASQLTQVGSVEVPANYGVHDSFVRDGLAFVCAWNSGVIIYDVGNGIAGGSPGAPREVGRIVTDPEPVGGARAHNAWWFHNPASSERRYLFVGQEGPGQLGASSSGAIHVVDVSNLAEPVEVATYQMTGTSQPAGTHNFWVDEQAAVLYAAYYNGGVVAIDVSGTLQGDLSSRELARFQPGGDSTYVWGVQLHRGNVYVADMLSGLYQLRFTGTTFTLVSGGNPLASDRYTSDLWAHGDHAYTGTWGLRGGAAGDVVRVWRLDGNGGPSLAGDLLLEGVGTVGDVEVSADGGVLLVAADRGAAAGLYLFSLADPERPARIAAAEIPEGVHTATIAEIAGHRYAFAAKNPPNPALLIYELPQ
jgi:hypothetical protein